MRDQMFKWTLSLLLALGLCGASAHAQEGTGHSGEDEEIQQGNEVVKRGRERDSLTRKEKKEQKELQKEHEEARKNQAKWEKQGLAARTAAEWYAEALTRYKAGKYMQAREVLLPLEDSARAIDIQEKVKLLVADTYYYQGGTLNLAEALARYRTFLTFHPTSEHGEYVRFQMGNCYFKQLGPPDRDQSYTDNAILEYESLIRDYPNGEYAETASQRVLEAKALRARHEFKVASFYTSWGNYSAAATRLEDLLANRPESPDREEALYLVANSLHRIGRGADAEAYAARLRADYPGSKYSSKAQSTTSGKSADALAKRDLKRDKAAARTFKSQSRTEERRTRQVRKDSGLPAKVPSYSDETYEGPVNAAAAAPLPPPTPSKAQQKAQKQELAHQEKMLRVEEEEQEKRAKELEREAAKAERAGEDERPKSEKQLAAEADKAAKAEEKAAQAAKKEAARMEKAEAEEQREAEKQAERDRKAQEARDEKALKKDEEAEKKAAKKGG